MYVHVFRRPPPQFKPKLNWHIVVQHVQYTCSLVPRPPPVFVLWFANTIHGMQTEEQKTGNEVIVHVRHWQYEFKI